MPHEIIVKTPDNILGLTLFAFSDGICIYALEHKLVQSVERPFDVVGHMKLAFTLALGNSVVNQRIYPLGMSRTERLSFRYIALDDDSGTQRVVNIVIDIRYSVGKPHDLPFESFRLLPCRVVEYPVAYLVCQVEPSAVVLYAIDDPQALLIMPESVFRNIIERALSRVSKRRMSEVVTERYRFGQIFVEPQSFGNSACYLRYFESMRKTRPIMVALRRQKDLGLILKASERFTMDNTVSVARKFSPYRTRLLKGSPSARICDPERQRRQEGILYLFCFFPYERRPSPPDYPQTFV
jgi:hypothetical protein